MPQAPQHPPLPRFPGMERLDEQLNFIREIDQAKSVLRRNRIADASRRENITEHAWHLAMMAWALAEHATEPVDIHKVIQMLLVHDIVEIDAGDTFAYDMEAQKDQAEREQKAADRLFALLPRDQEQSIRTLWEEFEARQTPEARFAAALDRLQPMLLNYLSGGEAWRLHGVKKHQVLERNKHIKEGSPSLWDFAKALVDEAEKRGFLPA